MMQNKKLAAQSFYVGCFMKVMFKLILNVIAKWAKDFIGFI